MMTNQHKVYALRFILGAAFIMYCLSMFGVQGVLTNHAFQSLSHMSGLRFFVMLLFFFPLVALISEIDCFVCKKLNWV